MPESLDLCVIHQPNFLPRLSTLAKIYSGDVWVILDDVQFVRRDYQHRARLSRLDGSASQWLSLAVHLPDGRASRICEVSLAERSQNLARTVGLIQQHYKRSDHWQALQPRVDEVVRLMAKTELLAEISIASTVALLDWVGWRGQIVRSSSFTVRSGRSERLADLTAAVSAARYLCGEGGSRYLDQLPFDQLAIDVEKFATPQQIGPWANARKISALWALMAHGPEQVTKELEQVRAGYQI